MKKRTSQNTDVSKKSLKESNDIIRNPSEQEIKEFKKRMGFDDNDYQSIEDKTISKIERHDKLRKLGFNADELNICKEDIEYYENELLFNPVFAFNYERTIKPNLKILAENYENLTFAIRSYLKSIPFNEQRNFIISEITELKQTDISIFNDRLPFIKNIIYYNNTNFIPFFEDKFKYSLLPVQYKLISNFYKQELEKLNNPRPLYIVTNKTTGEKTFFYSRTDTIKHFVNNHKKYFYIEFENFSDSSVIDKIAYIQSCIQRIDNEIKLNQSKYNQAKDDGNDDSIQLCIKSFVMYKEFLKVEKRKLKQTNKRTGPETNPSNKYEYFELNRGKYQLKKSLTLKDFATQLYYYRNELSSESIITDIKKLNLFSLTDKNYNTLKHYVKTKNYTEKQPQIIAEIKRILKNNKKA